MISDEQLEKYRNSDGSIDWGRFYAENQSLIFNDKLSVKKEKKIVSPQDLPVFQLADELSDEIWALVEKWEWFAKKTVGDHPAFYALCIMSIF
ncbi:MAG: hypothetical protein ACP5IX_03385 [Patescibacteria group bacterium]